MQSINIHMEGPQIMIRKYLKVGLFGLISWAVPYLVSVLMYPLRESQSLLFVSIMPVVLAVKRSDIVYSLFSQSGGRFSKKKVFCSGWHG